MERRKDQQFQLQSNFKPAGDQPEAISALFLSVSTDEPDQFWKRKGITHNYELY